MVTLYSLVLAPSYTGLGMTLSPKARSSVYSLDIEPQALLLSDMCVCPDGSRENYYNKGQ